MRRCVLELHAIAVKKAEGGGEFAVAMTALEKRRFLDGISEDHGAYYNMLGRVDVARSDCSRAADRESIHAGIRDSVGFGELGRMVFGVMDEWMVGELQAQAAAKREEGDERGEIEWCLVLGAVLGGLFLGIAISFVLMYVSSGLFFIAPFVILPLSFTILTGVTYRLAKSWFNLPREQVHWLMVIHEGEYLGQVLEPFYVLLNGLGALWMLGTGSVMLWQTISRSSWLRQWRGTKSAADSESQIE